MRLLILRFREWLLLSHIETTTELAESHAHRAKVLAAQHKATLDACHKKLRKVRSEIAIKAPPESLNVAIKNWRLGQ